MVIEDIYSFIGNPIIVSRGAEYYRQNKVIRFDKDTYEGEDESWDEFEDELEAEFENGFQGNSIGDTIIQASVEGSKDSPYRVKIFINECLSLKSGILEIKHQ